jgi:hypothetical protein
MEGKRCHELLEAKLVLGKSGREVASLGALLDGAAVGLAAVVGHLGINAVENAVAVSGLEAGKRQQRRAVSHGSLGSRALNPPSRRSLFQFFFVWTKPRNTQ